MEAIIFKNCTHVPCDRLWRVAEINNEIVLLADGVAKLSVNSLIQKS